MVFVGLISLLFGLALLLSQVANLTPLAYIRQTLKQGG